MAKSKNSTYYPPTADQFQSIRIYSCKTVQQVARMLHVSTKTIRNWEAGRTTVPYAAYKLLKIQGRYDLPGKDWDGWCLRSDKLWSPSGRSFMPYELIYISNMFAMARIWIKERQTHRNELQAVFNENTTPSLKLVSGGRL